MSDVRRNGTLNRLLLSGSTMRSNIAEMTRLVKSFSRNGKELSTILIFASKYYSFIADRVMLKYGPVEGKQKLIRAYKRPTYYLSCIIITSALDDESRMERPAVSVFFEYYDYSMLKLC